MGKCPYCGVHLKDVKRFTRGPPPTSITITCKKCGREVVFKIASAVVIGTKGKEVIDVKDVNEVKP